MRKVNEVMPLFIAKFLADTVSLDSNLSWAYMGALMHQWGNGPLPNDVAECSRIMRLYGPDSERDARSILARFFVQLPEGGWINLRNESIKRETESKAIRFSERGRKANEVRWAGHTRKWPARSPTRILQGRKGIHDGVLVDSLMEEKSAKKESNKESSKIPCGVPENLVPEEMQEQIQNPSPPLRSGGSAAVPRGRPPARSDRERNARSDSGTAPAKAKTRQIPPKTPQEAPGIAQVGNQSTRAGKVEATRQSSRKAGQKKRPSDPQKPGKLIDSRFAAFKGEFFTYWHSLHKRGINAPWGPRDGAALNVLLKRSPLLTVGQLSQCLSNRVDSEANPSQPAYEWLADVLKYAHGPLNRFGEPRRKA